MRAAASAILVLLICECALAARPEFMGLKIDAKSVVFVCDGSKWTQDKDDELIYELGAAIDALKSEQQVSVVFFADGKLQTFTDDAKPVSATEDNKRKLRSWLREVKFAGNSVPLPGLVRALELKTEAVIFCTSGEFRNFDEIESRVDALNKDRKIRLHTVGYFQDEDDDDSRTFHLFMKRLAERNGGRAVVAYADELRRKR